VHTTTVRFSGETWAQLKEVCERDGIATAQYIREATIARLAQSSKLPQVELRPAGLREVDLPRVREPDLVPGQLEDRVFALRSHPDEA
jgi:hypothetical protein